MITGDEFLTCLEWTATVLNLGFTLAIAYEKRAGWWLGFVASAIGIVLYALKHTWALSALSIYYVVMAAYGWWTWGEGGGGRRFQRRPFRFHAPIIVVGAVATGVLAHFLGTFLNGSYPVMDAFITMFSLAATWMMTRKLVENWLYFIVADAVAVVLNLRIGYDVYAAQYAIYIALSIAGLVRWSRALRRQEAAAAQAEQA